MNIIFYNGKILTDFNNKENYTAIKIKDDQIDKVGYDDEVLSLKDDSCALYDLEGKLVLPGFIDSHMHLLNYGYNKTKLNLSNTTSLDEIIHKSNLFLAEHSTRPQWLLGRGWNQDSFKNKFETLSKSVLDEISNDIPICFTRVCGHIAVVNTKALELCNITEETMVDGGSIDKDSAGNLTGVIRENALNLVYSKIPRPNVSEIKSMITSAASDMNKYGITSVHTDDFGTFSDYNYSIILQAYDELISENKLSIRVYEQCLLPKKSILNTFLKDGYTYNSGNDYFRIGPVKLLLDGSLGARTALLSKPYKDDKSTSGIQTYSTAELKDLVTTANKNGFPTAVHAIGDKSISMVLDIYRDQSNYHLRNGIVHSQITTPDIIKEYKKHNLIIYAQPIFTDYDMNIISDRLDDEYDLSKTYAWKSLLNVDSILLGFGSDTPVETPNVINGLHCAVNRSKITEYSNNYYENHTEKISILEAIKCYTINNAKISKEANIKGSIEVGKLADIVVLENDSLLNNPESILNAKVFMTIVGGRLVYLKK